MKVFVTGGTGYVGRYVVKKLLNRGYDVYALTRSEEGAADLAALGAKVVYGDITDMASMREAMRGSDVVFHIAGWYEVGSPEWMNAEAINVGGTRKVLRLAHELGIPKIIYTSTVAVFGDTHGELVDESFVQGGPFLTEYDRTKWLAHYKVVVPMIEKGAPVIIVMPGIAYGPGDPHLSGQLMTDFYHGRMPFIPGTDTVLTYAHVEDIAEGHLLAAEKGQIGESYILAGPAVPLGEMVDFWSQITGKPVPFLRLPSGLLKPFAPLVGALAAILPLPAMYSQEAINILGASYAAQAGKARAELGWRPRSLHAGMTETFQAITQQPSAAPVVTEQQRKVAGLALTAAIALLVLWLVSRRRK
jgi:dihydroflavonol-4-reductase